MPMTSRDTAGLTDEQVAALKWAVDRKMLELAPNANRGTRDYRAIERGLTDWVMYRLQVFVGEA